MAFRGDIYALILGALDPEPLHGYQLVRRLREVGGVGKLSEGQIYPYLHKLESEGKVSADWDTSTGGAPRRIYQLTPQGRSELSAQRELWKSFVSGVGKLMESKSVATEGNDA